MFYNKNDKKKINDTSPTSLRNSRKKIPKIVQLSSLNL